MKIKNKNKSILISSIVIVTLLMTATIYFTWSYLSNQNDTQRDSNGVSLERSNDEILETDKINNSPDVKNEYGSDVPQTPTTNPENGLMKANVVLTNTGLSNQQVDASGFVSNITEEDGKCTFIFSKDGTTVKKESATIVNPTSTTCRTVRFDKSELSSGEWTVTLEYASSTSFGTSNSSRISL